MQISTLLVFCISVWVYPLLLYCAQFQKYPYPPQGRITRNNLLFWEGVGSQKPKILKGNLYEGKLEFPDRWREGLFKPKTFCGEHMDIFWKNTLFFLWVRGLSHSNQWKKVNSKVYRTWSEFTDNKWTNQDFIHIFHFLVNTGRSSQNITICVKSILYLPGSQKVTRRSRDEAPTMKDVKSVYRTARMLLHANGLHDKSFVIISTRQEKKNTAI